MPSCRRPATPAMRRVRISISAPRLPLCRAARRAISRAATRRRYPATARDATTPPIGPPPRSRPTICRPSGNQTCSVCHTAIGTTEASYATLAGIAVLHTGISGNCGNATARWRRSPGTTTTRRRMPCSRLPHIPYLTGTDCSSCHAANYVAGGFGPATAMSAAKHAFVPTTCDTCHDTGRNFYIGLRHSLAASPGDSCLGAQPAQPGDRRLLALPQHNGLDHSHDAAGRPHAHPRHSDLLGLPHGTVAGDPNSYATLASIPVLHTGITTGCAQCHGGATPLTFYNNNDNPKAALRATHIPSFTEQRLQRLPHRELRRGRLRAR